MLYFTFHVTSPRLGHACPGRSNCHSSVNVSCHPPILQSKKSSLKGICMCLIFARNQWFSVWLFCNVFT